MLYNTLITSFPPVDRSKSAPAMPPILRAFVRDSLHKDLSSKTSSISIESPTLGRQYVPSDITLAVNHISHHVCISVLV